MILIEPEVLAYFSEDNYVFGLRQVVNHYHCSDPITSVAEVTNQLEFFIVNVSDKTPKYESNVFSDYSEFKSYSQNLKISSEAIYKLLPDKYEEKILHIRDGLDRCPIENRTSIKEIIELQKKNRESNK